MEIPGSLKCIQSWESTIKLLAEALADLLLEVWAWGRKGDNLPRAIASLLEAKRAGDLAEVRQLPCLRLGLGQEEGKNTAGLLEVCL